MTDPTIAFMDFDNQISPPNIENRMGRLYKYVGQDGLFFTNDSGGAEVEVTNPYGPNGAISVQMTAQATISIGQFVAIDPYHDGSVIVATASTSDKIVGVALENSSAGNPIRIQTTGIANVYIEQTGIIPLSRGTRLEVNNNGSGTVLSLVLGVPVYTNHTFAILLTNPVVPGLNQCLLEYRA